MAEFLKEIAGFDKDILNPSETVVKTLPIGFIDSESVSVSENSATVPATSWKKSRDGWQLQKTGGVLAGTHAERHGLKGDRFWPSPRLTTFCDAEARVGYRSMKAHEYCDVPEVLSAKTKLLAVMIRQSRATVAYTGAGISTSSGIPDYASRFGSGAVQESSAVRSPYEARPTLSHRVLVAMYRSGLLHHWIQQNHDGLPQKAGLPQEAINEIHGALYDPSNPVVPMSGSLRPDLFEDMTEWSEKAELCLAIGTTMCGMSADMVAIDTATRFADNGLGFGTIIVNLQRTTHDYYCSLRLFQRIDDVMAQLAVELGLESEAGFGVDRPLPVPFPDARVGPPDVFRVPYDRMGRLLTAGGQNGLETLLDLREDARVRVCGGRFDGDVGEISGKQREGHYKISIRHKVKDRFVAPVCVVLGIWFVDAAIRGTLTQLPVVNIDSC